MKKFLLGSVFAVLLLTGCNEEKKADEQTAPVVTEQKATEASTPASEEKADEQTSTSTEESKKAE